MVTFVWSLLAVFPASEDLSLLGDSGGVSPSDCEDRVENSEDADEDTDMVMIYVHGEEEAKSYCNAGLTALHVHGDLVSEK